MPDQPSLEQEIVEIWSEAGIMGRTFLILFVAAIVVLIGFAIVITAIIFLLWVVGQLLSEAPLEPRPIPPLPIVLPPVEPPRVPEPCATCGHPTPRDAAKGTAAAAGTRSVGIVAATAADRAATLVAMVRALITAKAVTIGIRTVTEQRDFEEEN